MKVMEKPKPRPDRASTAWTAIRKQLDEWPRPAVIALLKDLFDASSENRDFIAARFQADDTSGEALEKYREKVVHPFFPKRGYGDLKLGPARKAIRDYKKATGNLAGTLDLLLTYVESGTEFTQQFGDISGPFYDSLCSALNELAQLFLNEGSDLYPQFRDRLQKLSARADGIGWGYGDEVQHQILCLESDLGSRDKTPPNPRQS